MKYNYILGLDEADMKKIRGFRLRLVNLFFPALVDVLRRTAETKAYYLLKYRDEIELNRSLEKEINELKWDINKLTAELNELKGARDERLRKARANHSMSINDYQVALRSEQEKTERLKKEVKALNKTISKLKEQSDNKSKDNEVEGSSEVSGNERW